MHFKKQLSLSWLVALILFSLVPLGLLAFGIYALCGSMLFNWAWVIVFVLLPLVTLLLFCLVAFLNIHWLGKSLLMGVCLLLFVFLFFVLNFFSSFELLTVYESDKVYDAYPQLDISVQTVLPVSYIGNPSQVQYYDYSRIDMIIFSPQTETLFCQYLPEDYDAQVAFIDQNCDFTTEPLTADDYTCSPTFQLDGFQFRIMVVNDNYPKEMIFIGTNDQTKQIAYLSFWDQDLDYIEDTASFLRDNCGWKYIDK